MKKQKVVLFDIDFTLFDAMCYRDTFTEGIRQAIGYTGDDFFTLANEAYLNSRKKLPYFDPKDFIFELSQSVPIGVPHEQLEKIIFDEKVFQQCLYPDVQEALKQLAAQKDIILGIFSAGKIDIQRPKITVIESLLHTEHIHIYEFKKTKALNDLMQTYKDDKVYMIDDMPEILYEAKKLHHDITTILIKRKNRVRNDQVVANFHPDSIINSLEEVIPIINS